ncbi:MAG: glycosyltransferase [Sphingobacterium siyangense]
MMNIGIYVEGGHYLGLGNVYRMISLAKSLMKESYIQVYFITTSDESICELIQHHGFAHVIKEADLNGVSNALQPLNLAVLIVDVLNIDILFIKTIKARYPVQVVLFGNNNEANHVSDLVINAIISTVQFRNENYIDRYHTHYLKGPKYLTLRDEFEFQGYQYSNAIKNILLLFGGSDQANLSFKILNDLLADDRVKHLKFTVVTGAAYSNEASLERFSSMENVRILKNITNVNEVMLSSDFLFTSAGTSFFEGLYLGIPSVAFFQNDAQKDVFGNFFNTFDYEEVSSVVELMLAVYGNYECFCKGIADLEVGIGKKEIVETILNLKK